MAHAQTLTNADARGAARSSGPAAPGFLDRFWAAIQVARTVEHGAAPAAGDLHVLGCRTVWPCG